MATHFVSGVIDDGQVLDDASVCCPFEHKIHGPHLVGGRDLLALAPSHLQVRFGVEPIPRFVIHHHAGLPPLAVDHSGPVAPEALGKRNDPRLQGGAVRHWMLEISRVKSKKPLQSAIEMTVRFREIPLRASKSNA